MLSADKRTTRSDLQEKAFGILIWLAFAGAALSYTSGTNKKFRFETPNSMRYSTRRVLT
jgi:hypothetical protein